MTAAAGSAVRGATGGAVGGGVEFYLGTHQPGWLSWATVPLYVSDRRLRRYRRLPKGRTSWALDSGGFTELSTHGSWDHGPAPRQYVDAVRCYRDQIGCLAWAAPQDWMCEPWILAKTGLTVAGHLRRTVDNYVELRDLAPDLPFVPVIQGWRHDDYLTCSELYTAAGVDLNAAPVVGLGSVCRRQATGEAADIVNGMRASGIGRLHGFGIKVLGLRRYGQRLASADSLAWSYTARRQPALPGCTHRSCQNCPTFALAWRSAVVASIPRHEPLILFDAGCDRFDRGAGAA